MSRSSRSQTVPSNSWVFVETALVKFGIQLCLPVYPSQHSTWSHRVLNVGVHKNGGRGHSEDPDLQVFINSFIMITTECFD